MIISRNLGVSIIYINEYVCCMVPQINVSNKISFISLSYQRLFVLYYALNYIVFMQEIDSSRAWLHSYNTLCAFVITLMTSGWYVIHFFAYVVTDIMIN